MFPTRRRHPLTTFRFWFFVLGSVAVTVAWRFDLLPVRIGRPDTGRRADEAFTEVDLPAAMEWEEPVREAGEWTAPSSDPPLSASASPLPMNGSFVAPVGSDRALTAREPSEVPVLFSRSEASRAAPAQTEPDTLQSRTTTGITPTAAVGADVSSQSLASVEHAAAPVTIPEASIPPIDFSEIDRLSRSNSTADHIEAHRTLSSLYWERPELRPELRSRIDALAQRIYFQPLPHYMPAYEVQPGEMLQSIGKQHNVTWQYLSKLNRVEPERLRAGQRLKVIKGPFSAVIDLSDYELTIHAYGYYVTRYPVGIGKDGSTPIGTFTVQNKEVDPTYYGPEGVIAHDDPNNPLGERWIDIGNSYGIHGTIDPGSIGRSESRGCIRMLNDDVAAVYDLLTVGSEVTIRE